MKGLLTLSLTLAMVFAAQSSAQIIPVDSGFDPAIHAFSFENYGGDAGFKKLGRNGAAVW